METKNRILCIVFTVIISLFVMIPIFEFDRHKSKNIENLYRVYLEGKSIGVIRSKEKLEDYINEEQSEIKEKYGVDTVYAPKTLYIAEYKSYDDSVVSEEEIYSKIKETESFTIKGYKVNITSNDETDEDVNITFNVLHKEDFTNAITSVVKAFVSEDELNAFLNDEQEEIVDEGSKIEDLYIKEDITTVEAFIPVDEEILVNEKEVTKYLLFGDDNSENTYTVKAGDTIESIAENNKLAVDELLVVNPNLKNKNSILSIGEEISVALISPVVTVVEEVHLVEKQVVSYQTEVKYDNSKAYGTVEITQTGKNGLEVVTQKLQYENGDMVTALIADTDVIEEVVNEVKVIGTMTVASIDPTDIPDSGDWYWPTNKPYIITSSYGWRWGSLHDALDISGTGYGSPIYAANNGVVYKVWYDSTGGNQIMIAHANGYYTWYAHLATQGVVAGQTVTRGQKIGTMGSTGYSTGTHLHFAVYKGIPYHGGVSFNPATLYR